MKKALLSFSLFPWLCLGAVTSNNVVFSSCSTYVWYVPPGTNIVHSTLFYGHSFNAGLIVTLTNGYYTNIDSSQQSLPLELQQTNPGVLFWKGGNNIATTNNLIALQPLSRNGFELYYGLIAQQKWGSNNCLMIGSGYPGATTAQCIPGTANWNTMTHDVNAALIAMGNPNVWDGAFIWLGENDYGADVSFSNNIAQICAGLTSTFGITNFSLGIISTNSVRYTTTLLSQQLAFIHADVAHRFTNDISGFPLFTYDNVHPTWVGMYAACTNAAKSFKLLP